MPRSVAMKMVGHKTEAIYRRSLAYYNLVNRVASGLGVELEPELEPWEFGAQR